jgi:hypothetical protein
MQNVPRFTLQTIDKVNSLRQHNLGCSHKEFALLGCWLSPLFCISEAFRVYSGKQFVLLEIHIIYPAEYI